MKKPFLIILIALACVGAIAGLALVWAGDSSDEQVSLTPTPTATPTPSSPPVDDSLNPDYEAVKPGTITLSYTPLEAQTSGGRGTLITTISCAKQSQVCLSLFTLYAEQKEALKSGSITCGRALTDRFGFAGEYNGLNLALTFDGNACDRGVKLKQVSAILDAALPDWEGTAKVRALAPQ